MEIAKIAAAFVYAANAFITIYKSAQAKARTAAIRADPGGEWLRKLGGKSASSSDTDDT